MKTCIIFYGRCQPCVHIGHEMIFNKMREQYLLDPTNTMYYIYLSKSFNKNNPVPYDTKIQNALQMLSSHKEHIVQDHSNQIIQIVKGLSDNFDNIIMYTGSDRVASFRDLLIKYNNIEYNFENIKVLSAGSREGFTPISAISGTSLRENIKNNNYEYFKNNIPSSCKNTKELFDNLKNILGNK